MSFISIIEQCNNISLDIAAQESYYPFFILDYFIGLLHPSLLNILKKYFPQFYHQVIPWSLKLNLKKVENSNLHHLLSKFSNSHPVTLSPEILISPKCISIWIDNLVQNLRQFYLEYDENVSANESLDILYPLKGWRNEKYGIWSNPYEPKFECSNEEFSSSFNSPLIQSSLSSSNSSIFLFEIERAAIGLFGLTSYGVHVNGVVIPSPLFATQVDILNGINASSINNSNGESNSITAMLETNVQNFKVTNYIFIFLILF